MYPLDLVCNHFQDVNQYIAQRMLHQQSNNSSNICKIRLGSTYYMPLPANGGSIIVCREGGYINESTANTEFQIGNLCACFITTNESVIDMKLNEMWNETKKYYSALVPGKDICFFC